MGDGDLGPNSRVDPLRKESKESWTSAGREKNKTRLGHLLCSTNRGCRQRQCLVILVQKLSKCCEKSGRESYNVPIHGCPNPVGRAVLEMSAVLARYKSRACHIRGSARVHCPSEREYCELRISDCVLYRPPSIEHLHIRSRWELSGRRFQPKGSTRRRILTN
jgi:hypothetical protein